MNTQLSSHQAGAAGRIPTGFWPKAQGCEARATLGRRSVNPINRNAVVAKMNREVETEVGLNPVGVEIHFDAVSQGSSFLATLGWKTQSLWDCRNARPISHSHAGGAR